MKTTDCPSPEYVWSLIRQLQRRGFSIGLSDYEALREALLAGFGLSSRNAFRDLCCALWAKSPRERRMVRALLHKRGIDSWNVSSAIFGSLMIREEMEEDRACRPLEEPEVEKTVPATHAFTGLPPIETDLMRDSDVFTFEHCYPLSYRQAAQAWRRFRRPKREGPPVEMDLAATIDRRCRTGVAASVAMVPRKRNTARLLVLVDRKGSMAPFHAFTDEVCAAILESGNLEQSALFYFHNLPVRGGDRSVLTAMESGPFPNFDTVLDRIKPISRGVLYTDPELRNSTPLNAVLNMHEGSAVAVLSDAGAARARVRTRRILDTLAFAKGMKPYGISLVWINPLEPSSWEGTSAMPVARHLPMFPMDGRGMHRAVDVLRGRPCRLENPI